MSTAADPLDAGHAATARAVLRHLLAGEQAWAREAAHATCPALADAGRLRVAVLACAADRRAAAVRDAAEALGDHGLSIRSEAAPGQVVLLAALPDEAADDRVPDALRALATPASGRRLGIGPAVAPGRTHEGYALALTALGRTTPEAPLGIRAGRAEFAALLPEGARVWARSVLAARVPEAERAALLTPAAVALSHGLYAGGSLTGEGAPDRRTDPAQPPRTLKGKLARLASLLGQDEETPLGRAVLHLVLRLAALPEPEPGVRALSLVEILGSQQATEAAGAAFAPLGPAGSPAAEREFAVLTAWTRTLGEQSAAADLGLEPEAFTAARGRVAELTGLPLAPLPWDGSYDLLCALVSVGRIPSGHLADPAVAPRDTGRSALADTGGLGSGGGSVPPGSDLARLHALLLARRGSGGGGKDAQEADARLAFLLEGAYPRMAEVTRANESFVQRATVRSVADGVPGVLDLGCGRPCDPALADLVREVLPGVRYAGVDNNPVAIAHCDARLAPDARRAFVTGDVTEPEQVLDDETVAGTLDLTRPVVLVAGIVYQFNHVDLGDVLRRYLDRLPTGSRVVLTNGTLDIDPEPTALAMARWRDHYAPVIPRTREEIAGALAAAGLDILDPRTEEAARGGPELPPLERLTMIHRWRRPATAREAQGVFPVWAAVGVKR